MVLYQMELVCVHSTFSFEPEEVITCKLQLELSMIVFRIEPHLFDVTPEIFSTNGTSTRLCLIVI